MNIETNRLLLIPINENYTREIFENFNENVITYMLPTVAKNINETQEVVDRFIEQRKNNTDYVYAITIKETGAFIGLVGLHNFKNEIPELGVWTKVESHGNHYGREAIGGVIKHARELGIRKMCYPVDRRNIASRKIPLFYGGKLIADYKEVKTLDGRTLEVEEYEIQC